MSMLRSDAVLSHADVERPAPGWLIVMQQELRDLWLGGRGLTLMLVLSFLLSVLTYLAATNKELNLLDQQSTVNMIMQIALGVGVALVLLLSADALSGERERGTLESLLLTPLRPRQIAFGKLLAALSVWPVVMALTIPYLWALRAGSGIFIDAVTAGAVVGTLLVLTFACLGLVVSTFANSNRLSLAVTFFVFVILIAPTQLPGGALSGWLGDLVYRINPMSAGSRFLDKIVASNHTWGQEAEWLIAPVAAAVIAVAIAYVLTGRLRLQGGMKQ